MSSRLRFDQVRLTSCVSLCVDPRGVSSAGTSVWLYVRLAGLLQQQQSIASPARQVLQLCGSAPRLGAIWKIPRVRTQSPLRGDAPPGQFVPRLSRKSAAQLGGDLRGKCALPPDAGSGSRGFLICRRFGRAITPRALRCFAAGRSSGHRQATYPSSGYLCGCRHAHPRFSIPALLRGL